MLFTVLKYAILLCLSIFFGIVCSTFPSCFEVVNEYKYDDNSCQRYWRCTVFELLRLYKLPILRSSLSDLQPKDLGHTPLWLRVSNKRLHCVLHPNLHLQKSNLRLKPYRALHYINRINKMLKISNEVIPNETEWWSHQSDWVKIPLGADLPPVFSISGMKGYADLAGIPFMSFTDKIAEKENRKFEIFDKQFSSESAFHEAWRRKKGVIYFRGGLTDCEKAANQHKGDVRYCARAKIVLEKVKSRNKLLSGISTYSKFSDVGLRDVCDKCFQKKLEGGSFVEELVSNKYLLNFPGAGNWSRRMAVLLRSGGVILQAESSGYQFFEFNLKPGLHYIPFDVELGSFGSGNLISRVQWAKENQEIAREIAFRSGTFGKSCLNENSINYFVGFLLQEYSKLLTGKSLNLPMVDLSRCIAGTGTKSIARLCKETIQKCWN